MGIDEDCARENSLPGGSVLELGKERKEIDPKHAIGCFDYFGKEKESLKPRGKRCDASFE